MRIVVAGAGCAGITAVLRLVRSKFPGDIVLVNDAPHHELATQMHRVAAGAVEPSAVLLSIDRLLRWTPARFVQDKVTEIEPERRVVRLAGGDALSYNRLVVALGSRPETFGVPGVLEHALTVQPVQEALRTRRHLTARLHDAAFCDGEERRAALRFVIVGGGLTGVELAGELADRLPAEARGLGVEPSEIEIIVMEAGPRILQNLDEPTAERVAQILERKHITVRTETSVAAVVEPLSEYDDAPAGVRLADGRFVPARTVIWAAGVRAHELVERTFAAGERGRALVDEYLRARDYPDVYIIGDSALAVPKGGTRAAAPTAQNAVRQAEIAAQNLLAEAAVNESQGREVRLVPYTVAPPDTPVLAGSDEAAGATQAGEFWKPRLSGFSPYASKWAAEQRYKAGFGYAGNKNKH